MMELSDYERDAFVEAFNLGMGVAAASLSEMTIKEVALSVPNIEIMRKVEAARQMTEKADPLISGVRESFSGPFSGNALLVFPVNRSLELVRLLLQQPEADLDFLTEMEEEALVEVGNIILNACLGSIAEIVGEEILNNIPHPVKGALADVVLGSKPDQNAYVLKLHMDFIVREVDINGYIAFVMDIESLDLFRTKLAKYFGFAA